MQHLEPGKALPTPPGKGTAASYIDIARSQLGVEEGGVCTDKDDESYGKPNSGNITDYGKFTGYDEQPWCASFVSWLMDKNYNGNKKARDTALRGRVQVGVKAFREQFKKAGAFYEKDALPGDFVIFMNDASHIGLVEKVDPDGTIHTIEGNTGSGNEYNRNGGVVARHKWTLGDGSSLDKKLKSCCILGS